MSNAEYFINIASQLTREGAEDFMLWLLEETDFLSAPASTNYHGSCEGGLLAHSLCVYDELESLTSSVQRAEYYDWETLFITAMFHDVCKVNTYAKNADGLYTFKEELPFGSHGGKSVYLITSHGLKLTDEEAVAINCHMGGFDTSKYNNPSAAFNKYPLALYLHIADMLATYSWHK